MERPSVTSVVLLACGSFNPITNMHLRMFELARDHLEDKGQYKVVRGIISPVGYKKEGLIEASHRREMARLATENSDWITLGSWESSQPKCVERVEVLRHHYEKELKTQQNRVEMDFSEASSHQNRREVSRVMLLCGTDVLESFEVRNLWKQEHIDEIAGSYGWVAIARTGFKPNKFKSDFQWKYRRSIHLVHEWVANDTSCTGDVRLALRRGQSVRYLLPDAVVTYIQQNDLYIA
ncbi:nicotinamide/nicotinic acid mononucleotide adenylyltransferase 1-like [Limanda limanda]|uniref:nicotinamide/nicotinic acid mononucleotide adenylyltransferase 1-like n=1 Tax=Limanda limanda TaxID=27771 RepID=UPI0029C6CB88|nr:nicotinamide/nicotinic acid mononucleotide adenylyltransferase 1-like [Limanda limanda]